MIQKIRVITNPDLIGQSVLSEIQNILNLNSIKKVKTIKTYRFPDISKEEAKLFAEKLLSENINQEFAINKPLIMDADHFIEISYKPGVMNPEIASIIKAAKNLNIKVNHVESSREYAFYGKIKKEELAQIITRLNLFNPTVEYIRQKDDPVTFVALTMMTNEELMDLSQDKLFLNLEEMKIIQNYFKKINRNPTDCELETIAQTWSEHSGHKTFKAQIRVNGKIKEPLIKRIKKEALKHSKNIVSAFIDNSGVIDFYDDFAICGKVETHNSPSAIEPYGGAMTGSGGVFRDILGTGLGAKTLASTDIFCFANPDLNPSELPVGCLPPRYLLKKVVSGVRDYGNRMGIPTNNGSLHFHDDFRAKPTVIVGAYGIIPKKFAKKRSPKIGDLVVTVGGKTGRDGIHGATFSSGEMTDRTISVNSSAVQIGNAIEQKRMFDAILEARDKDLIRAIQDCGGGGFSSAIGEIAEKTGVSIDLEKAPLKYDGLYPWEIWLSESQERMILAVPKDKLKSLIEVCEKYNTEVAVLGKFDGSKKLRLYFHKEIICDLDMNFLHNGLPQRKMTGKKPSASQGILQIEPKIPNSKNEWLEILKKNLSNPNICSKEPILRLYDHSVQGTNILKPFTGENMDGPNDAVVLKPFFEKDYGMVISHGLNPVLNNIHPYWGSIWAATEALSNYTAVGGDYRKASLINNYIWPFPDEESLWSLDKSVDAVCDFMKALKIPVVSGKDSLSSTYRGKDGKVIKIPPVLCISVFGKIENIQKTVTSDFKKENSTIVLVGKMDFSSMGGSSYFEMFNILGGMVPHIDLKILPNVLRQVFEGIQKEKILAAHDISEGGLITTLFEMGLGGSMGTEIDLNLLLKKTRNNRADFILFNETAGCFITEVENEKTADEIFKGVPYFVLGKTTKLKNIKVKNKNKIIFEEKIDVLKKVWQEPMRRIFG